MVQFGWMLRLGRSYARSPKVVGFSVLAVLIVGLAAGAVITGFTHGFWPNLLLNAAGDMLGGMVILLMIEPIVSRAAVQIRQHAHLDFRLFARRIGQAEREIRVLDTFSGLFDNVNGPRALPGLQEAVLRGVSVRILLMSPTTDASRLRQEQLDPAYPGLSIDSQIHNNISSLGTMEQLLAQSLRRLGAPPRFPQLGDGEDTGIYVSPAISPTVVREPSSGDEGPAVFGPQRPEAVGVGTFELRLYSVAAPFTLYQRDDTLLFAMLPAYQFAHDAPQLEITAGSLTGLQILEKFDELWEDARPVRRLAPVRLSAATGAEPMWVRYLELGDVTYYVSSRIDAALEAKPDQHFWLGEHDGVEHEAELVPRDSTLYRQLLALHDTKYATERRREPRFYQMWSSAAQPAPRGRTLDFDRLPTEQIVDRLAHAERSVRILDTSSILIGQDGDEAGAQAFVRAALEAMANGATIKILLLAPTTSAAQERAKEIRDEHFDQMVERNIQRLRYLATQLPARGIEPDRLQVRLYDRLPEISVHQMDDRVLVGFLPYRRRSSMASQLETERHSELGVYAVGQFEQLWNRARPLDGLRYVILRMTLAAMQAERLLVRAWQVGGTWYLASARVEELLGRRGVAGPSVRAWIEEVPAVEFRLSDPLVREENIEVWDAFARIYSTSGPGIPVRALNPVR
ncbi:MAG TPA: DUF5919 domain-containing protein [Actinospica sp.]|nr:DUF5919 domain-containing protein [Actinospica sp.]